MKSLKRISQNILKTTASILLAMFFFAAIGHGHEWMAPQEAARRNNPITADSASVAKGKEIFSNDCAYCHGEDARGMSREEAGLNSNTPDLVKRLANHSEGDFFWKIENGRGEMPAFQEILSDEEIWHVINFIKSR